MAHRVKIAEETSIGESQVVMSTAEDEAIREKIQLRAYYRYCDRGCAPGGDVSDWLAAEQEVLAERSEERR